MDPTLFEIEAGRITVFGMPITFLQMIGILVFDVLMGVLGEEIARYKGHPKVLWLFLCGLFPPFLFLLLGLENRPRKAPAASAPIEPRAKVGKRARG